MGYQKRYPLDDDCDKVIDKKGKAECNVWYVLACPVINLVVCKI